MTEKVLIDNWHQAGLIGLLLTALAIIYLGFFAVIGWVFILKGSRLKFPDNSSFNWNQIVKRAAQRIFARTLFVVLLSGLFFLFWQNAYVKFYAIELTNSTVKISFCLCKDITLNRNQIDSCKIIHDKRSYYLELISKDGQSYRSVGIDDMSVRTKLEHLNITGQP